MLIKNYFQGKFRSSGAGCFYCVFILPTLSSSGASATFLNHKSLIRRGGLFLNFFVPFNIEHPRLTVRPPDQTGRD